MWKKELKMDYTKETNFFETSGWPLFTQSNLEDGNEDNIYENENNSFEASEDGPINEQDLDYADFVVYPDSLEDDTEEHKLSQAVEELKMELPNKSNLFKENEEWIVTKNDPDGTKVACCREDESNLYDKTRDWGGTGSKPDFLADEIEDDEIDGEEKGCPSYFIRDILNSEKLEECFYFKEIPHTEVLISGTVTSAYPQNNNFCVVVDDGTGSIMCLVSKEFIEGIKIEKDICDQYKLPDDVSVSEDISWACSLLNQCVKEQLQDIPLVFDEQLLGQVVSVKGKLSEYNSNRYIFVEGIQVEKKGSEHMNSYFEEVSEFYRAVNL